MNRLYTNEVGKSRLRALDCQHQSRLRREWCETFQERLRQALPESLHFQGLTIVGSVAKNQAGSASDIDVVIQHGSADPTATAQIRKRLFALLEEMQVAGELTYRIEVQQPGNPLMFSKVAMYKKEQVRK